jgi:hypothetical protein
MLSHLELCLNMSHCSILAPCQYRWHSSGCSEIGFGLLVLPFYLVSTCFVLKLILRDAK